MFLKIIYSLYNYIVNNYDIVNQELIDAKSKLKKTYTLKKQFYKPNLLELKNKIFFRNLKYLNKINSNDLIKIKQNLKKNN